MTTDAAPRPAGPRVASTSHGYPRRFRAGAERNRRIGRALKVVGRVKAVDERLLDRIGRAMLERDELGARLAEAIRSRAGQPGKVTMEQFRQALEWGVGSVPDAPPALVDFFTEVETEPDWLDWEVVERGGRIFQSLGQNASDVLLQLSLVGGYRFGGPTDLLVATGGLTGEQTLRRLAETQKWGTSLSDPGSLRPPRDGRPSGEGWRLTVHVRLMHAFVNHAFEPRWDVETWGLPINQADQASTLGLFDGVLLIGSRALGVPIPAKDSRALMHLWKWVGHLMGVDGDFLVDDEWERHRINYHVLLAQGELTDAGPQLARAVVEAQALRVYPGWPRPLQGLRARYERERLLSMLTVFLSPDSMREFGLPLRPPWAHAYVLVLNTLRYRVLGRTARGRQWLWEWGGRRSQQILDSYFVDGRQDVGELKA
ncbi:oxygenase MpaB family protein [Nocardioides sp. SYSU DS0651]|uniref:oxygenase MpaB family protein n=1 Tax=Nocardioides sp. SYSU DS0651 TaxID=3415955 RepID=UPI003F4BCA25